jgi:alpha-tubulin suppressor-like RCC1 family protein
MLKNKILFLMLVIFHSVYANNALAGTVVFWGYNLEGSVPSPLKTLLIGGKPITNAVAVAAGDEHGLALRSDGTVVGFGFNGYGQTIGSSASHSEEAAGLVKIDGRVVSNVVAIAAGGNDSLALQRDGTVISWGQNILPKGISNIAAIAAEQSHSIGLKRDGTVIFPATGETVGGLSNVVAVAAVVTRSVGDLALQRDGTVFHLPPFAPIVKDMSVTDVASICGGRDGLAIKKDGTVFGWGLAADMPKGLTNIIAIAGGRRQNLALRADGTVVMWGSYRVKELAVPPELKGVTGIAVGADFFLAITTNDVSTLPSK